MSWLRRPREAGRHETPAEAPPVQRPEVGLFVTPDNPHVGPRQRRGWRKKAGSWPAVSVPTAPYVEVHAPRTAPPEPAAVPDPIPDPRPYVPRIRFRVPGPPAPAPSPVREAVLLTARASNFKYKLTCGCGGVHTNTNADRFRDLYISAENAGWQQDLYRVWRCPRCARRHQAAFGVRPVAAIEAAA